MDLNPVLFPQVTNRESWAPILQLSDAATGDLIDLTGVTFQLEVRRAEHGVGHFASPFVPFYDDICNSTPRLSASLGNGIVVLDIGTIQWTFSETQMRTLHAGTYRVALVAADGSPGGTRQIFLGRLPVLDGGVTN